MMHFQINGAISSVISDRVIPEIRNIVSSMTSSGNRDTDTSSSSNDQENRERTTIEKGLKAKFAKKDSWSGCDLRVMEDRSPYR